MWKIPLFDLDFDEREYHAVKEVLDSKWLSIGEKTKEFEDKFSEYLGKNVYCTAVSSGTAALHISLMVAGIKPKDEVIISGLTFVAAVNVAEIMNAVTILADCNSIYDWNVSPEDIERKITDRTKALIIVHFAGYPCSIDKIKRICDKRKIILMEDCAHAVGAEYKGKKCGTFGDMACFSFFSNKNLSIGEGGMFVTRDKKYDYQARLCRSHGMNSMTVERYQGKLISYDVLQLGLNYRIDELRSAIGLVQLNKLDKNNIKRQQIVSKYIEELSSVDGLVIPWKNLDKKIKPSYHIFPILLPEYTDRKKIIEELKKNGIQTSIHYPSIKKFNFYKKRITDDLELADIISERALTLPLYPNMSHEDIRFVSNSLKKNL